MKKKKVLSPRQVLNKVTRRLIPISKLSFLEQYAMFMGKAQLIENKLKGLLGRRGYKFEYTENWTMGRCIKTLKKEGLRTDFILLLEELLQFRNSLAHDYLAIVFFGKSLAGDGFVRLSHKELRYALFKVEEVIQVYDFLFANKYLTFTPLTK